jgi:hypothetical protein
MLRANLSTRPFYNVRAVRAGLGLAALAVVVTTAFNVGRIFSLRASEATLSARATDALAQAERLRTDAALIRAQVDFQELELVAAAAGDANDVIEQRAFSWSRFLALLEAALPGNVRITSVQPSVAGPEVEVVMTVQARRTSDLGAFMDALEGEGAFRDVLPVRSDQGDDGIIDVVIQGVYTDSAVAAASAPSGRAGAADGEER